jgi:hypothetical protein
MLKALGTIGLLYSRAGGMSTSWLSGPPSLGRVDRLWNDPNSARLSVQVCLVEIRHRLVAHRELVPTVPPVQFVLSVLRWCRRSARRAGSAGRSRGDRRAAELPLAEMTLLTVVACVADGLCLTFYTSEPGKRGDHRFVSQADWDRYSSLQFFTREQMPDVRALVSRFPIDS